MPLTASTGPVLVWKVRVSPLVRMTGGMENRKTETPKNCNATKNWLTPGMLGSWPA
jgi:hypothetical protein